MPSANVFRLFYNPFSAAIITFQMLIDYTTAHLVALVTDSPGAEFPARVAATTAAANALNASMAATGSKLGMQKMQTEIKKAFRAALPGQIAEIYVGLAAVVGAFSPILLECFPQGRSIFSRCKEGEVDDYLQMLAVGLSHHATNLPPELAARVAGLITTWNAIYEAASTAKGTKKTTSLSRKELRTALEAELFKNALMLAILFPDNEAKAAQYCPKYLLEPRTSSVTPGPAVLALVNYNALTRQADFTIAAEDAETFQVYRRMAGEADFSLWAEDIEAVDGAGTYSIGLGTAGIFEFVAEGVNGSRTGERSAVVSVGQS